MQEGETRAPARALLGSTWRLAPAAAILFATVAIVMGPNWLSVTADRVYGASIAAWGFDVWTYRTTPSPYLVPDLVWQAIAHAVSGGDAALEMAVAGALQTVTFALAATLYAGPIGGAAAMAAVLLIWHQMFSLIGYHLGVAPLLLLWAALRPGPWRVALVGVTMVSDPLFALAWLTLPLLRSDRAPEWPRGEAVAVVLGFGAAVFLSETNGAHVPFVIAMVVLSATVWGLLRLSLLRRLAPRLRAGAGLLGMAALLATPLYGLAKARYVLAIGPVSALVLGRGLAPRLLGPGRPVETLGMLVLLAIAATVSPQLSPPGWRESFATALDRYACAARTLESRGVEIVAADYWQAKLIDLGARRAGVTLTVAQLTNQTGRPLSMIAPHAFLGPTSTILVSDAEVCEVNPGFGNCPVVPGAMPPAIARERLCNGLELVTYAEPVPDPVAAREAAEAHRTKMGAFLWSLRDQIETLKRMLGV